MWLMRVNSKIIFGFIITVVSFGPLESSRAQESPLSIRGSLGASYLPMTKTTELIDSWRYGEFKNPSIHMTGDVGFNYGFSEAMSATLKIGFLKTSAKFYPSHQEDPWAFSTWDIQAVPVSLGLEYRLLKVSERVSVFCGARFAGWFSQVRQSSNYGVVAEPVARIRLYNFPQSKVTGTLAAIGGSLGVSIWITELVAIVPEAEYNYVLHNITMQVEDNYGARAFPEIDFTNMTLGLRMQFKL